MVIIYDLPHGLSFVPRHDLHHSRNLWKRENDTLQGQAISDNYWKTAFLAHDQALVLFQKVVISTHFPHSSVSSSRLKCGHRERHTYLRRWSSQRNSDKRPIHRQTERKRERRQSKLNIFFIFLGKSCHVNDVLRDMRWLTNRAEADTCQTLMDLHKIFRFVWCSWRFFSNSGGETQQSDWAANTTPFIAWHSGTSKSNAILVRFTSLPWQNGTFRVELRAFLCSCALS